ncbi:MAG: PRC-barrel domain-containing protein [Caldilineaceae bacterium]
MLHKAKDLFGAVIKATDDNDIGTVHDFYFDAETWEIRYLVVDVGSWLFGRRVLIAPDSVQTAGMAGWDAKVFPVNLTREQVKDSPPVDFAKPISRQYEADLSQYYGWPAYWGGAGALPYVTGAGVAPAQQLTVEAPPAPNLPDEVVEAMEQTDQSPLQSVRETAGYAIRATDGRIGNVMDFLIDEENWTIRYLVVDTGNWLPGRQVLVARDWIEDVDWHNVRVNVKVTKAQVKDSPVYDPFKPLDQAYEDELHEYYDSPADQK